MSMSFIVWIRRILKFNYFSFDKNALYVHVHFILNVPICFIVQICHCEYAWQPRNSPSLFLQWSWQMGVPISWLMRTLERASRSLVGWSGPTATRVARRSGWNFPNFFTQKNIKAENSKDKPSKIAIKGFGISCFSPSQFVRPGKHN